VQVHLHATPLLRDHLDHRKLYLIDGRVAFTGGMNLGQRSLHEWRDQQTRVEGPAVVDLLHAFLTRLREVGGAYLPEDLAVPRAPEVEGGSETRVLAHRGRGADRHIKQAYLAAIATAQERILIADPYVASSSVLKALRAAARRGVQVQLMVPRGNDMKLLKLAARAEYRRLHDAGVEIFEYHGGEEPGRMAHHKIGLFDDRLVLLGSSNLDNRSLKLNEELNLSIDDPRLAGELLTRMFAPDRDQSNQVENPRNPWWGFLIRSVRGLL
jgi:cardiolipin synthase